MAVSRRLRYEVLRRDGHKCRYCGRAAPDVELTADHVVPKALGGTDKPDNLVAACADCNGGKTSVPPDAALVADVAEDALRWARAQQTAADKMLANVEARNEYHRQFEQVWHDNASWASLPSDWRRSVDAFLAAGLPMPVVLDCARKAASKPRIYGDQVFKYMCGVAWRRVEELRETAETVVRAQPSVNQTPARTDPPPADWPESVPWLPRGQRDCYEVPAWIRGQHDLAEFLMERSFGEEEIKEYVEKGYASLADDECPEDEMVMALGAVIPELVDDLDAYSTAVNALFDVLSKERLAECQAIARAELAERYGSKYGVRKMQARTVWQVANAVARDRYEALPEDERHAWWLLARKRWPNSMDVDDIYAWAGRWSGRYRLTGELPAGTCMPPGLPRIPCHQMAEYKVFYEKCLECDPDGECCGHYRWCREHYEEIREDPDSPELVGVEKCWQIAPEDPPMPGPWGDE